jgi:hypothetical protein
MLLWVMRLLGLAAASLALRSFSLFPFPFPSPPQFQSPAAPIDQP